MRWLRTISEGAANSLEEGLEETLTVHRIAPSTTGILRTTRLTTNPIASIVGQAADLTRRVKRWRDNEMVMRWLGSSLIWIEPRLRRVRGHKQLPALKRSLQTHQTLHSKAV